MPTLNWIGKEKILTHHHDVPFHVLEHKYGFTAEGGVQAEATNGGNMIIHGDNLIALKSLLPKYEGKIDCIYIDPPYNTGEEKWVYNDNVNDPRIRKWLGEVVGKQGEDLSRHDKWLCMMTPRLILLNKLLAENGVIAINIGYQEVNPLVLLCKSLFSNKQVVCVTVQTSGGKPSEGFNYVQEYVVFIAPKGYSPNPSEDAMNEYSSPYHAMTLAGFNQVSRPNQAYAIYIEKETGVFHHVGESLEEKIANGTYTGNKEDYVFDYSAPEGLVAVWPVTTKGDSCVWRLKPSSFEENWEKGYIKITPADTGNNQNKFSVQYLADGIIDKIEDGEFDVYRISEDPRIPTLEVCDFRTGGVNIPTMWTDKLFYTSKGSAELAEIFGKKGKFPYPKPVALIKNILQRISKKDSIILDSFGGSGTTAHAVQALNKEDGGNRKFILIEMMDYAEDTTAERVKRVMKGYSYKGEKKYELFSKKLTVGAIKDTTALFAQAESIIKDNEGKYDRISRPTIAENCLKIKAKKTFTETMPGLGGAFDFYELGERLFDEKGFLNENAGTERIREYVYYSETKQPLPNDGEEHSRYFLGSHNRTDYYFYYEPDQMTTLSPDTLSIIERRAELHVVYADVCLLNKDELALYDIVFKKIPRDIRKF